MAICGPSDQAMANEAAQTDFYKNLSLQQSQIWGQQQDLLNQIRSVTAPILAKGPQQYGFTPGQEQVMESAITNQGAKATADVVSATQLAERQKTGGANIAPTGASAELEENARILGGQQTATNLSNLKLAGYQAGNQIYTQALGALGGVAGMENPNAYASSATSAGEAATKGIQLTDSENSNLLQTMLGGAIQGGMNTGFGALNKSLGIPI